MGKSKTRVGKSITWGGKSKFWGAKSVSCPQEPTEGGLTKKRGIRGLFFSVKGAVRSFSYSIS